MSRKCCCVDVWGAAPDRSAVQFRYEGRSIFIQGQGFLADPGRISQHLKSAVELSLGKRVRMRYAKSSKGFQDYEGYLEAVYGNGFTLMTDRGYRLFISYIDLYCRSAIFQQGEVAENTANAIHGLKSDKMHSRQNIVAFI